MSDLSWRFDHLEYNYIKQVLDSGFASGTSGNMNTQLETAFAKKMERKFAITFNSGTTTLHAALTAFGVGYGDEVIIPGLTVISCMNAVLYCNAIPVFADINSDDFLINPEDIRRKITPKTKAIMPVHLYGKVCDMTEIMNIANEYGLKVVEDCAQCYLGTHKGKIGGTFGEVGSFSFENSKHLTTGDGGIIICDDEELGDHIRKLNSQGYRNVTAASGKVRIDKETLQDPNYKRHTRFGFMYRLPEVAAAMGLAQLEKLDWFVAKREIMTKKYRTVIDEMKCPWLIPQYTPREDRNSCYTFAAKFEHPNIKWKDFRNAFIKNGGDGIYAAWTLCYLEDSIPEIKNMLSRMGLGDRIDASLGQCLVAESVQPKLMQFTTNQKDESEMGVQCEALHSTIKQFM